MRRTNHQMGMALESFSVISTKWKFVYLCLLRSGSTQRWADRWLLINGKSTDSCFITNLPLLPFWVSCSEVCSDSPSTSPAYPVSRNWVIHINLFSCALSLFYLTFPKTTNLWNTLVLFHPAFSNSSIQAHNQKPNSFMNAAWGLSPKL